MICNHCDNDSFEEAEDDGFYSCLQCGVQAVCATPNQFVISFRKKTKLASPINNETWSDEDERVVLKKLLDFRVKSGNQSEIDWDDFYGFIGSSIAGRFSKKQVFRKIKNLKSKFLDHYEKIRLQNDPEFSKGSDSEAFKYSRMLWGVINGESDLESFNELEEPVNGSGVAKLPDNQCVLKALHSKKDKEQHNEAGNIMENDTSTKVNQEDYDELGFLRDAFYTLVSSSLSDHEKELQLEKLMYLGAGTKRQLSDEWRTICAEETEVKIQKFRFSAMLGKAAEAVTES